MAVQIIPRLVRGDLYFKVGAVLFPTLAAAMCAVCALLEEQVQS